jgi:primosomal protein N' (replication factor Y)
MPAVVRVLPKVTAIGGGFDYLVPDRWAAQVGVGTMVRVSLHGRRVDGWVVEEAPEPPATKRLLPLLRVRGVGPAPEVVDLARWGAWRWAGPLSRFLVTASPERMVHELPPPGLARLPDGSGGQGAQMADDALSADRTVVRLPPAADPFPLVLAAARRAVERNGCALVVCPAQRQAAELAGRLSAHGVEVALLPSAWAAAAAGGRVVLGTRKAAWGPAPELAAAVVLDAHDRALAEDSSPTWDAWVVAAERARRAAAPCVLVSPSPSLGQLAWGRLVAPSRRAERRGWPPLVVVDRRREDPRTGLFSPRLVPLLRQAGPGPARRVLCVLNRTGRAALVACGACGELYRCERCGQGLSRGTGPSDGDSSATPPPAARAADALAPEAALRCRRCGFVRPLGCPACGSVTERLLRPGVVRVREELTALAGQPVEEVTAASPAGTATGPLVVGTDAVLHRADGAKAVVFLDFDQELLAGRLHAGEEALSLLARGARLVGGRDAGGRLVVQTRVPGHPALLAALHADPGRLAEAEAAAHRSLGLAPPAALALVRGEAAPSFVEGLRHQPVDVSGPSQGSFLVRAASHRALCDALASAPRPPRGVRIEVDPRRA